jgi:hypothetical protein
VFDRQGTLCSCTANEQYEFSQNRLMSPEDFTWNRYGSSRQQVRYLLHRQYNNKKKKKKKKKKSSTLICSCAFDKRFGTRNLGKILNTRLSQTIFIGVINDIQHAILFSCSGWRNVIIEFECYSFAFAGDETMYTICNIVNDLRFGYTCIVCTTVRRWCCINRGNRWYVRPLSPPSGDTVF